MPSRSSGALAGGRAPSASVVPLPARMPDPAPSPATPLTDLSDDAELHQVRDALDHAAHASLAHLTGGLSPAALTDAYMDWAVHLAISPGKQVELAAKAARKWTRIVRFPRWRKAASYSAQFVTRCRCLGIR